MTNRNSGTTTTQDRANQLATSREQHMATIKDNINAAYKALNNLPDEQRIPAQKALQAVWRKNLAIADLVQQAEHHLAEADATFAGMNQAIRQLADQRNQILGELDSITQALISVYGASHPLVDQFANAIMEDHNAAFWESLPYDFAQMLGENWSHMDADDLYAALTVNLEEKDEGSGDYGYTRDELVAFRTVLLDLVRQFLQKK